MLCYVYPKAPKLSDSKFFALMIRELDAEIKPAWIEIVKDCHMQQDTSHLFDGDNEAQADRFLKLRSDIMLMLIRQLASGARKP